jgi:hypothetical protein
LETLESLARAVGAIWDALALAGRAIAHALKWIS